MAKIDAANAESRQEQQSHEPAYALSYLTSDFATGMMQSHDISCPSDLDDVCCAPASLVGLQI